MKYSTSMSIVQAKEEAFRPHKRTLITPNFFYILVSFALLDPDPHGPELANPFQCGSGSESEYKTFPKRMCHGRRTGGGGAHKNQPP
jgi:hypothetical protein